jgi:Domain of unknown function (DUF4260)
LITTDWLLGTTVQLKGPEVVSRYTSISVLKKVIEMPAQSKAMRSQAESNTKWKSLLLRAEGTSLLAMSVLLYWINGASWALFALLFLAPDLSLVGYAAGQRVGAATYNALHAYPLPAILAAFGLLGGSTLAVAVALVWFAHVEMDRTLG